MLLEFYGTECPHCERMAPLIERLEKEKGVTVQKYEVWHNSENAAKLAEYDKDMCGGVPFFYNAQTGAFICGEATYEEFLSWADSKGRTVQDEEELKKRLTPEQYAVVREGATERPFSGKYYHTDEKGDYRCVVCDTVLFSSDAKFDSGTGWPSFDAASSDAVELRADESHGMVRTEVVCKKCGAHLGHLFDDGPTATGKRFCINSAALDLKKKE